MVRFKARWVTVEIFAESYSSAQSIITAADILEVSHKVYGVVRIIF